MLEARHLTKYYAALPAIRDVSFRLVPGSVLGLLGPNGSGKSTTVSILTGLLEPSGGQVFVDGADIRDDLTGYKARLGYVPEEAHLYTYLTGPEYLRLIGRLRALPEPALERKIDAFLEIFGLTDDRHAPLSAYSKGMRQKILISAALLHDPRIVILDEPNSGLDVTSSLVLRSLVQALAAEGRLVVYRWLPFTRPYRMQTSSRMAWPLVLLAFSAYVYTLARFEADFLHRPGVILIAVLIGVAVAAGLDRIREAGLAGPPGLVFDNDDPDALFGGFGLSEGMAAAARRSPADAERIAEITPATSLPD